MSPSLMDTRDGPSSPCSLSAEESNSNTAGSEREGEGHPVGTTGRKRQERNREAARKTRRKQTERADELHEELQRLEQSNGALQTEIAALKKDHDRYTKALARHEPYCHLRASEATSRKTVSASHSGGCQSTFPPSLSSSASRPLFSATLPYCVSDRHSLFSKVPAGPAPLSTSLLQRSTTSSDHSAAAHSRRDAIHNISSAPADAHFPPLNSGAFLMDKDMLAPPFQLLAGEIGGPASQAGPVNVPQPPLGQHSGNPNTSSPRLQPALQDPGDPSPPPAAASVAYGQQTATLPMLSLLTIPSPLHSGSSSDSQPLPSLLLPDDASADLSLSELLEGNDWILSGTSDQ